jgi:tRNA/rRNA methyltransferase
MAGTDRRMQDADLAQPAIILVRPQMGQNIGAAARAMLNFGLGEMRLVAPRDGWPNPDARAMASRADEVLDHATVFESVGDAVADLHQVFATTARGREMAKPVTQPRDAAEDGHRAIATGEKVGFLFGAERAGLDNDEVALASAIIHIPANPAFASLNLAQAVLLVSYEWRMAAGLPLAMAGQAPEEVPATSGQMQAFLDFFSAELDSAGMFDRVEDKRPTMLRNLRTMFHRARLSEQEVRTLFGMLRVLSGHRQNQRKR